MPAVVPDANPAESVGLEPLRSIVNPRHVSVRCEEIRALAISQKPSGRQTVENPFGRPAIDRPEPRGLRRRQTQAGHLQKFAPDAVSSPVMPSSCYGGRRHHGRLDVDASSRFRAAYARLKPRAPGRHQRRRRTHTHHGSVREGRGHHRRQAHRAGSSRRSWPPKG